MRLKLLPSLDRFAPLLLKISHYFDRFGHDNTGFTVLMQGKGQNGKEKSIHFELYAEHGDGLYIPCIPAIVLAQGLAHDRLTARGAMACVGLISLEQYLAKLRSLELAITWQET